MLESGAALAFRDPFVGVTAISLCVFCVWLRRARGKIRPETLEPFVARLAAALLVLIVINGFAQPNAAEIVSVAAILPVALAFPFVHGRRLIRLAALSWLVAVLAIAAHEFLPHGTSLPPLVLSVMRVISMGAVFGLALVLLWQSSSRLKDTARELRNLVSMSGDLARTLEPKAAGDLIARHIAEAVGADECGLCYWDAAGDRLLTYGYYPPERRAAVEEAYSLDDYPATRRVLDRRVTMIVSDLDREADPAELAYLQSIAQRSMATVPLVANGRALGAIEVTSGQPAYFDRRRIRLIETLAAESALALDNARLYDELRHQAFHDSLTGLANRTLFRDRVEHAAARRRGPTSPLLAVMFLDLDDFKSANDSLGHDRGDELLASVAERFKGCLRPGDTAARLGGDEFAILLEDLHDEVEATSVAQRLIDSLRAPISVGGATTTVATSIGIRVTAPGFDSADELLRDADFAMYRAKNQGKGRYEVFRPSLRTAASERAELEVLLAGAVDRDELRVHYQPIVELASGRISGIEALVRWQPSGRALLMPGDFIGMAEDSGLIVQVGRWVLERACRDARAWQDAYGLRHLSVSVNLSARQFQHPDLVAEIRAVLAASGLEPSALVLEITESVLMQTTTSTIGKLSDLRQLGIRLAIDDFGTGYSSLSYLQRFPVDILKIDKAFVDGIDDPGGRPVLARAITQLAHALDLEVIAEGIEEPGQVAVLRRLGCGRGQGYLFARPLPESEICPLLESGRIPGWIDARRQPARDVEEAPEQGAA